MRGRPESGPRICVHESLSILSEDELRDLNVLAFLYSRHFWNTQGDEISSEKNDCILQELS